MTEKTSFQNLKEEVWDAGTCSGCGACVAVCPADALFFDEDPAILHPASSGYCKQETDDVPCGACYAVCPRVKESKDSLLGDYIRVTGAKATGEIPYRQNGGAVTALLMTALNDGTLDGVITVTEDRYTHRPISVLITSTGELIRHAGTRYNWSVPVLYALKEAVINRKFTRLAVVGTPCVVSAARLIKGSTHDLVVPFGKAIRLIIGLFCTESFDYSILMKGILAEKGFDPAGIVRMNVKGKLDITLADGTVRSVSLKDVDDAVRHGCRVCRDFTGLESDISAGSVGTPDQMTTLLIRNPVGEVFIQKAVMAGNLVLDANVDLNRIEDLSRSKLSR